MNLTAFGSHLVRHVVIKPLPVGLYDHFVLAAGKGSRAACFIVTTAFAAIETKGEVELHARVKGNSQMEVFVFLSAFVLFLLGMALLA